VVDIELVIGTDQFPDFSRINGDLASLVASFFVFGKTLVGVKLNKRIVIFFLTSDFS